MNATNYDIERLAEQKVREAIERSRKLGLIQVLRARREEKKARGAGTAPALRHSGSSC